MNYKISKEASFDLEHIWLYNYENWTLEQADRSINLIMDEVEYLANNPKSGRDYEKIRKYYFRSQVKSRFIFYKINFQKEEIEIIRILHQRMDLETQLDE